MTLGEKIKLLRTQNKMTQEELANKLNTTKQTIFKYENGIVSNLPLNRVMELAEALNVDPAWLMGWEDSAVPEPEPPKLSESKQKLVDLIDTLPDEKVNAVLNLLKNMM